MNYERSWKCEKIKISKASIEQAVEVVVDINGDKYPGVIHQGNFTELLSWGRRTNHNVWMPGAEVVYMIECIEWGKQLEAKRQKEAEDFRHGLEKLKNE